MSSVSRFHHLRLISNIILICAIFALLVEGTSYLALRLLSDSPAPRTSETHLLDAHRNHRLNPLFRNPEGVQPHSEDGFRADAPYALEKAPKTIRIVAMGTSALYGIGAAAPYPVAPALSNKETIPGQLQEMLSKRVQEVHPGWRVEVLNAGVSAYRTFNNLEYLISKIIFYSPDIVFDLDGHNDFYEYRLYDRWDSYNYSTNLLVDQFNGRTFYLPLFSLVRSLSPYSNFFNLMEKLLKRKWYAMVSANSLPHTQKLDLDEGHGDIATMQQRFAHYTYLTDLNIMHSLGRRFGYLHCTFLQPEVILEDRARLSPEDKDIYDIAFPTYGERGARQMHQLKANLESLFADEGIPFHDISSFYSQNDGSQQYYIDYCHLTPAGAKAAAKAMLPVLLDMTDQSIRMREK
jgi:hypothetical protein